MPSAKDRFESIVSLVVMRIFAKRKKGMISNDDFDTLATFGVSEALQIVTTKTTMQHFQEMVDEELRKALELIARSSCGLCQGTGIKRRKTRRYVICNCVDLVHYRGDDVLPPGDQFSNEYFSGETSKDALGRSSTVLNIANAVGLMLIGA